MRPCLVWPLLVALLVVAVRAADVGAPGATGIATAATVCLAVSAGASALVSASLSALSGAGVLGAASLASPVMAPSVHFMVSAQQPRHTSGILVHHWHPGTPEEARLHIGAFPLSLGPSGSPLSLWSHASPSLIP